MVTGVTNHVYGSAAESPYIVQIKMVGTGEAGVVEGSDKIVVTVTEVPVLLVSAGENVTVEAGATAQFRGTFTRPVGGHGPEVPVELRRRLGHRGGRPRRREQGRDGAQVRSRAAGAVRRDADGRRRQRRPAPWRRRARCRSPS